MHRILSAAFRALCAAALLLGARGEVVHRWSFNEAAGNVAAGTTFTDTISGAVATVVGVNATASGTALTLPGSTTATNSTPATTIPAYLDLPNGIVSARTNMTVEIWATPVSQRSNQRLFDFGRMEGAGVGTGAAAGEVTNTSTTTTGTRLSRDTLNLNISRSSSLSQQRLEGQLDAAMAVQFDSALSTTGGTQYHYVVVFEDGVGTGGVSGGRATWYRNGTLVGSIDLAFRLQDIEDVNNWLGRSQNSANFVANISYDEVRIHDHVFSSSAVAASRALGPNPAMPVAAADSIAVRHGQKVRYPVLANDANGVAVQIVQPPSFGTAVADADGRVFYTHTSGAPASDSFTYRALNGAGASAETTVTITFSPSLRLSNPLLNVPAEPPATAYSLPAAFNGFTFTHPICLRTPPDETQRLFVCEKGGVIRVITDVTAATPDVQEFFNLAGLLTSRGNEAIESGGTSTESGLLALAFHPDYASNRQFYVFYTVLIGGTRYQRVSRFLTQPGNANAADTTSELVLIQQRDEASNHNGGDLHFGSDGYLYISVGDEGGANDGLNNSQRITRDLFAGILRIDVDNTFDDSHPRAPRPHPNPAMSAPVINAIPRYETAPGSGVFRAAYSIPADNPFVHTSLGGTWDGTYNGIAVTSGNLPYVRSELWATGLRNPWRFTFDKVAGQPDVLWCGDVGQGAREEVSIIERGKNYGWKYFEGFIPRAGQNEADVPGGFAGFDANYHARPVHDYPRSEGQSITGGVVYRGTRISALVGVYVFADYLSGNVWTLRSNVSGAPTVTRILGESGIVAFGTDPSNDDVLAADLNSNVIRRLVTTPASSTFPTTLSATDLFADLSDLSPNPGLVPYSVNLPFWSDHGIKRRWFTIPDPAAKMTWSRDGVWSFPAGQIWVKHFDLPLDRDNPTVTKRIETRVLVRNADGAYGVSYRWNDAGTDATLVADEGVSFPVNVTVGGVPAVQKWSIPSRAQCIVCHTAQAGHALGFTTRQLNREDNLQGAIGNELNLLSAHGYFTNQPEAPNTLPRHVAPGETSTAIEARARSYFAVNCAYCHQAGGTAAPAQWDGRPDLTLAQTGLIHGTATNNGGNTANKLIVPGDTLHSVVLQRIAAANGFTRMPPLGSNELDQTAIALITQWIGSADLVNRQDYAQWRLAQFNSSTSPEGEPGADPDGDGSLNEEEFLLGTLPLVSSAALVPEIAMDAFNVSITLEIPANRAVQVEATTNFQAWAPWNVPGNDAVPRPPGPATFIGPRSDPQQFFRLRVWEN